MSPRDVEALVERAIRLLHEHDVEVDHRSAFCALWRLQERLGGGFTHFRVMPILLARRAAYRFSKDVHPAIDALAGASRELGYTDDEFLYCDAGTMLWRQLTDELSGDDRAPPSDLPLATLVTHVRRAAEAAGDDDTLRLLENALSALA